VGAKRQELAESNILPNHMLLIHEFYFKEQSQ